MQDNQGAIAILRESGYRLTSQRVMVLSAIREMGGHVSVDAIHRHVRESHPLIDLATVYRTVGLLKRLHLLNEVVQAGVSRYEMADPDHRHHHMVCEHCGKAIHLSPRYLDGLREQLIRDVGFEPHMEHFTISGLCADCREDVVHSHDGHVHDHVHGHMHDN